MEKDSQSTGTHTHQNDRTPKEEALLLRMKAISERMRSSGQALRDLFEDGNTEALNEEIDSIATDLRMGDPENASLLTSLRMVRNSSIKKPGDEASIVARVKELQDIYRNLVVMESGLPDEARLTEIEKAKEQIQNMLAEGGYEGGDPAEALHILGFIEEQEGEVAYSFPDYLPPSIKEKWCIYLTSVIEHLNSEEALEKGQGSQEAVMDADRTRTYAHNSVTTDVHSVLGLEGDKGWAFKDTRQLLANIRDYVLPTEAAAHSEEAQQMCAEYHRGLVVSAALSSRPH